MKYLLETMVCVVLFINCSIPIDENDENIIDENDENIVLEYPPYLLLQDQDSIDFKIALDSLQNYYNVQATIGYSTSGYFIPWVYNIPSRISFHPDNSKENKNQINLFDSSLPDSNQVIQKSREFLGQWCNIFCIDTSLLLAGSFRSSINRVTFPIQNNCAFDYHSAVIDYSRYSRIIVDFDSDYLLAYLKIYPNPPCLDLRYKNLPLFDIELLIDRITQDTIYYQDESGIRSYVPESSRLDISEYGIFLERVSDTVFIHLTYNIFVNDCWLYRYDAINGETLLKALKLCF